MAAVVLAELGPGVKVVGLCADLEDELIRALGVAAVEEVVAAGGRKAGYARLLVDALELACVPSPLDGVHFRV